jgi:hypothetical protein
MLLGFMPGSFIFDGLRKTLKNSRLAVRRWGENTHPCTFNHQNINRLQITLK